MQKYFTHGTLFRHDGGWLSTQKRDVYLASEVDTHLAAIGEADNIWHEVTGKQMDALNVRIADQDKEIERLQLALAFWLPNVPAEGPEDILNRVGDDAMLLGGLKGDPEPSAEERGWIKLSTLMEQ